MRPGEYAQEGEGTEYGVNATEEAESDSFKLIQYLAISVPI
jgi:hypothetical protein